MFHSLRNSDFIVIGNPEGRRIALFQEALSALNLLPAKVVTYPDIIMDQVKLPDIVKPGDIVRIESPGKDFNNERLLIAAGAENGDAGEIGATHLRKCNAPLIRAGAMHLGTGATHLRKCNAPLGGKCNAPYISREEAEKLAFDKGRLLYAAQWYRGFCATLEKIAGQLAHCPPHRLMNHHQDIALMFDKPRTHSLLYANDVNVAKGLGPVNSFEELRERMAATGCHRVFIKLAYGSSASGIVAYRRNGHRQQAITTVEMAEESGKLQLYNTRRIRTYNGTREISTLINALCHHPVHVEEWIPKAGIQGKTFDLRVVVINGQAMHTVVRQSNSPMTNLHLLNTRGDLDTVKEMLGLDHWKAAQETCEAAARCFPRSLYAGIDLLITPDYGHHVVLEVNAFGDLIPGILFEGQDTYTAEIECML